MKRRICLLLSLVFLMLSPLPALTEAVQPTAAPPLPSLTDRLFLLFGQSEADVLASLGQPAAADTDVRGEQRTLKIGLSGEEAPVSVNLVFYNDVFMAAEYAFDGHEAAYLYAKKCRAELEEALGEKTTYPGVISGSVSCFDDLTDESPLAEMHRYYEDWTPVIEEEIIRQMVGEMPVSRVDLRMELSVYPGEYAAVSMKYMAIRDSLQ